MTLKKSLIFLFSALICFTFFTNFTFESKPINTELLCKTWYIISGEVKEGNMTEQLPEDMINAQMIFYKNFEVTLIEPESDDKEEGTWRDDDGNLVVNIDNEPITFTIKTLSESTLIIWADKDGIMAEMTLSSKKKE